MTTSPDEAGNSGFDDPTPRIGIIGVGGAGGNAINNMIQAELAGVNFLAANTDAQALAASLAPHSLQLGAGLTSGLGSGAQVSIGRAAAKESESDIRNWVSQCDLLFIAAGMGGGTGTGAAPVIAELARDEKTLSVGVITLPFDFEGPQRMRSALEGLRELEQIVDTLIVIPNQNLFTIANANTTFANAFVMADAVLHDAIRGITDLIVLPGLINLDFADVKTIITRTGRAMMGTGEASGPTRAIDAAEAAIANPLLDVISIKGAQGLLVNVTGGTEMTLFEIDEATNRIRTEIDNDSLIIFGSAFDPDLEGKIRVSVVATGLRGAEQLQHPIPEPDPEPEPEPLLTQRPAIEPVMEAVREAVLQHASQETEIDPVPTDDIQQIPSPTVPLPQSPGENFSASEQPKPPSMPPLPSRDVAQEENELPGKEAPEPPEKDKSAFSWAGKIFRP
jgi:cell division protein FtsZ